ncbi:Chaperone protein dnaJ [Hordeum vulgare]|nr:Chaperone protein dnaJ [Hordeum vulgare]
MGEADHYRTLGLRRDASKAEVKAAFSRLALLHHPDRHAKADAATRADATRRFRQVYDAYHVLYDDSRRAEYDLRTSSAWSGFGQHGAKSRSSSASGGYGHGGASSSHSGRYSTLRVAEVVIDGWKLYNTWKSSRQSSIEKEAEESEEKMKNEPSEEKE